MNQCLDRFLDFLAIEKGLSANTLNAYGRDLAGYVEFLETQAGVTEVDRIAQSHVIAFLNWLQQNRMAPPQPRSYP